MREMEWQPRTPPRETERPRRTERVRVRSKREGEADTGGNVPTGGSTTSTSPPQSSPLLPTATTDALITTTNIIALRNSSSADIQDSMLSPGSSLQGQLTWAAIWFAMEGLRIYVVDAAASVQGGGGAREDVKAELWEKGGRWPLAHVDLYRGGGTPV